MNWLEALCGGMPYIPASGQLVAHSGAARCIAPIPLPLQLQSVRRAVALLVAFLQIHQHVSLESLGGTVAR